MRKTTNYGLSLYETTDKMSITSSENSLNANMEIIDKTLKEKATIDDMTTYIEEHKEELKGADGTNGIDGKDGKDGENGTDGQDGYSPTAKVETTSTGATITITDKNGTTTTTITNGKDGVDGVKGDKGDKGDTGSAGKDGTNGKDGVSVTHSWNGTTLIVTSASGTSSANLKGEKGDTGSNGADGYTPVKGTDYWTEEDKEEIATQTKELISLDEYVKSVNNTLPDETGNVTITVTAEQPEFIVKDTLEEAIEWLEENGDTTKKYVLPDGYIYGYIKTTVVIPPYTNKVPTSTSSSGTIYNGTGYKEGYRLNSSGVEVEFEGAVCSGFIPIQKGDIIRVLSDSHIKGNTGHYFNTYNSSFTKITTNGGGNIGTWKEFGERHLWTIDTSTLGAEPTYFRSSTISSGTNFIVTVNENVDGEPKEVEMYKWANTGHSYVSTDYEDRIIILENTVSDLKSKTENIDGVPEYITKEAEEVADKVLATRNAYSFVFGAISDTHTDGVESASSIIHAGMGLNSINKRTQLDAMFNFGDIAIGYFNDTYEEGFPFVKECLYEISRSVPYIQMQGNHDQLSTDTTEEAQQKYYAYVGANNVNTITDWENRFRNYGYRDFKGQKIRVIYLNTVDVSEVENEKDVWITAPQYSWLINTALDFSDKSEPADWGIIVCSHHPLNWYYLDNLLTVLNAYKGKTSGSITVDNTTISYNFTSATSELIAHFHGHLHNFRAETLGTNNVTTITIPNACFGRNNEYGSHSDSSVRSLYGDTDENGNQRVFAKTSNTSTDTAFNIIVVDRQNKKIHCFNYGAGIDREISYL